MKNRHVVHHSVKMHGIDWSYLHEIRSVGLCRKSVSGFCGTFVGGFCGKCLSGFCGTFVNGFCGKCVSGFCGTFVSGFCFVNACCGTVAQMVGRSDFWVFGESGGRTDGRTAGQSDRWSDGRTVRRSDERSVGRTVARSVIRARRGPYNMYYNM